MEEGDNIHFSISSSISSELKIDQSVAHNGVCLTVINVTDELHKVTAIRETLDKSNLGQLQPGSLVNLERCMQLNDRLDGHIVQGHVDVTARVESIENENGSWLFTFQLPDSTKLLVEKGSVCINGVSLTVVKAEASEFSVAIIPFTYEHTSFKMLRKGDAVNIEYDIIGKYVQKMIAN